VVTSVGIRSWILKPYLDKLQALEAQVKALNRKVDDLRVEVLELHKNKADKERLHLIEKEMESVENLNRYLFDIVKELRNYVYAEMEGSGSEPRENQQTLEEAIIELIKQGYDSPKNLARKAKIGVGRLYQILERLEKENRIRTIKKGRKKKIIVIED